MPLLQSESGVFVNRLFGTLDAGVECVQLLAGLEAYGFAGGDADFGAGARIATDAGLARADAEDAETAEFDTFSCCEGFFEALKHRIDGRFCLGSRKACALDDLMNNVLLDQCRRPLMVCCTDVACEFQDSSAFYIDLWWPAGEMLLRAGTVVNLSLLQYDKQLRHLFAGIAGTWWDDCLAWGRRGGNSHDVDSE